MCVHIKCSRHKKTWCPVRCSTCTMPSSGRDSTDVRMSTDTASSIKPMGWKRYQRLKRMVPTKSLFQFLLSVRPSFQLSVCRSETHYNVSTTTFLISADASFLSFALQTGDFFIKWMVTMYNIAYGISPFLVWSLYRRNMINQEGFLYLFKYGVSAGILFTASSTLRAFGRLFNR